MPLFVLYINKLKCEFRSMKIVFSLLCINMGDYRYVEWCKKLVNQILEYTDHDIIITTNKKSDFSDLQSNRILIRNNNITEDLKFYSNVPKSFAGMYNKVGEYKFDCNLKFLCLQDIPEEYDVIFYLDCDAKLEFWDASIDQQLDSIFTKHEFLGARLDFTAKDQLEAYRNGSSPLYSHKIQALKAHEWDTRYDAARLPSEHFFIISNDPVKLKNVIRKWREIKLQLQETDCVTWGEAFEFGVALYHGGFTRLSSSLSDTQLGITFNGNR